MHLCADWLPSFSSTLSSSLMGWPALLLKDTKFQSKHVLTLREQLGRSERQWKGMLSWMLAVAGARQFLAFDGYRWIAPLSAFYPRALPVDVPSWHPSFPPTILTATRPSHSVSQLRPDYVALAPFSSGTGERWAVAEAKGTAKPLSSRRSCPGPWYRQARNIELWLSGESLPIPRHIVVATRVNPNAVKELTRRLQVRAWNSSNDFKSPPLPATWGAEVATAHLFGVFRNLNLIESAKALASAAESRSLGPESRPSGDSEALEENAGRAFAEIERRTKRPGSNVGAISQVITIEAPWFRVEIELSRPLLELSRSLMLAGDPRSAADALRKGDRHLDEWHENQRSETKRTVASSFGIVVHTEEFGGRG